MKTLIVGDSPRLETGFGRLNRKTAQAFLKAGHEVKAVEALQVLSQKIRPRNNPLPIDLIWPIQGDDPLARETAAKTIKWFKPDVVFLAGEPGNTSAYRQALPDANVLSYQLIEGAPIVKQGWAEALASVHNVSATEYGANVLRQTIGRDEPWVYSGVDHDVFNVTGIRDDLRKTMVKDNAFVIMTVAQNVRRKQITRLIEAVSILRYRHKRTNVILYIHSSPFQQHWLEGWNLFEIVQAYGIADITVFHPGMMKGLHNFAPERTDRIDYPGLVEMYNAADLFVLPSQVEGFGLPIAEAMACGLPVLVTKYAAGWELAEHAGRGIPVHDWEISKSGQKYGNVDPAVMADMILKLMRNPSELARMRAAGLTRAQDFQWDKYQDVLTTEAERIYSGNQASSINREQEDTGTTAQEKDEHLRQVASKNPTAGLGLQPAG